MIKYELPDRLIQITREVKLGFQLFLHAESNIAASSLQSFVNLVEFSSHSACP